jgi:hypothetical protein
MAIPNPELGLVISYSYLWHHEHAAGHEEGRKDRPSVIVLAIERANEATLVTVLPITHSAPENPETVVEIPPRVKSHLGLDDARSWIVVDEGNEFLWPGYDLRKRANTDGYDYGFLPPRLFAKVHMAFRTWLEAGKAKKTPRE